MPGPIGITGNHPLNVRRCDAALQNAGEENFKADQDQNHSAENRSLTGQTGAKGFADPDACQTYGKGDNCNQQRTDQRHLPVVFRNGKADYV